MRESARDAASNDFLFPAKKTVERSHFTGYRRCPHYRSVPMRYYFTDSDEANELIAREPLALPIGFALDQQITVQAASAGR